MFRSTTVILAAFLATSLIGAGKAEEADPVKPAATPPPPAAPAVGEANLKAMKKQTAAVVRDLELALHAFRLDFGRFPWTIPPEVKADTRIDPAQVYAELAGGAGAKINAEKQAFLAKLPAKFLKDGKVVDSWGNEIRFRVNADTLQLAIWSCGPNGVDESDKGESPEPEKKPKTYYWFGKNFGGDDIGNHYTGFRLKPSLFSAQLPARILFVRIS